MDISGISKLQSLDVVPWFYSTPFSLPQSVFSVARKLLKRGARKQSQTWEGETSRPLGLDRFRWLRSKGLAASGLDIELSMLRAQLIQTLYIRVIRILISPVGLVWQSFHKVTALKKHVKLARQQEEDSQIAFVPHLFQSFYTLLYISMRSLSWYIWKLCLRKGAEGSRAWCRDERVWHLVSDSTLVYDICGRQSSILRHRNSRVGWLLESVKIALETLRISACILRFGEQLRRLEEPNAYSRQVPRV